MAPSDNEIILAYRRIAILKAIVVAERERAAANPLHERNTRLGLSTPDLPLKEARQQIENTFAELLLLLDHLHVAHTAAQFEFEAKRGLAVAINAARDAVAEGRRNDAPWRANLVRDIGTFDGLRNIERVLDLSPKHGEEFKRVRATRNTFSHGAKLDDAPGIAPAQAFDVLLATLDRVRS